MLFKLYCLPGKVLAHLNWLFPDSHMDAVRSARQRDSSLIHFLGSSSLYALIALFVWMANRPDVGLSVEAVNEDEQVVESEDNPRGLMVVIDDPLADTERLLPEGRVPGRGVRCEVSAAGRTRAFNIAL